MEALSRSKRDETFADRAVLGDDVLGSGRDRVGITCPLLRPEAPQPGSMASTTATSTPASRRCSAVDSPVKPPPMTTTSAAAVPTSSGRSGPGGVAAAHSEAGHRTLVLSIVVFP